MVAMADRGEGFDLKEIQNDDIPLSTMLRNMDDDEALEGYFYAEMPLAWKGALKWFLYKAKRVKKVMVGVEVKEWLQANMDSVLLAVEVWDHIVSGVEIDEGGVPNLDNDDGGVADAVETGEFSFAEFKI